jgi:hypothetical protein
MTLRPGFLSQVGYFTLIIKLDFFIAHNTGPLFLVPANCHKLLRDYADENSCLIFGLDTPTTKPYSSSATPDVFDIAVTKEFRSRYIDFVLCTKLGSPPGTH